MASSRRLYAPSLPCQVEIRNKKHKLRNDLLDFFDEKELVIPSGQVSSSGETFVASLVNTLWYIDGHHHVFNERSHKIPTIFENTPETSKHRKRSIKTCQDPSFVSILMIYIHVYKVLFGRQVIGKV